MSDTDFDNFAALEVHNRMESLKEIRMIVCGIVLFNKDTGSGHTMEQNIPDRKKFFCNLHMLHSSSNFSSFVVTKTLVKSYDSIESLLQFTLCDIMDRVNIVRSFVSSNCLVSISICANDKLNFFSFISSLPSVNHSI